MKLKDTVTTHCAAYTKETTQPLLITMINFSCAAQNQYIYLSIQKERVVCGMSITGKLSVE